MPWHEGVLIPALCVYNFPISSNIAKHPQGTGSYAQLTWVIWVSDCHVLQALLHGTDGLQSKVLRIQWLTITENAKPGGAAAAKV